VLQDRDTLLFGFFSTAQLFFTLQTAMQPEADEFATMIDECEKHPHWYHFAQYCQYRSKGLRKRSLEELVLFITDAQRWNLDTKKEFVACILPLLHGSSWKLCPEPLWNELLTPTLLEWADKEPTAVEPRKWLGNSDRKFFYQALQIDPRDDDVRHLLVRHLLRTVNQSLDHLYQNYYAGEPREDLLLMEEGLTVTSAPEAGERFGKYHKEFSDIKTVIEDFIEFSVSGASDFKSYCIKRGRPKDFVDEFFHEWPPARTRE
jgi:hypothetical protein